MNLLFHLEQQIPGSVGKPVSQLAAALHTQLPYISIFMRARKSIVAMTAALDTCGKNKCLIPDGAMIWLKICCISEEYGNKRAKENIEKMETMNYSNYGKKSVE